MHQRLKRYNVEFGAQFIKSSIELFQNQRINRQISIEKHSDELELAYKNAKKEFYYWIMMAHSLVLRLPDAAKPMQRSRRYCHIWSKDPKIQ